MRKLLLLMRNLGGNRAKLLRIGLNDEYSVSVGNQKYLRVQYGMDSKSIVERIKGSIEK